MESWDLCSAFRSGFRSGWNSCLPPPISSSTHHTSKAASQQRTITSPKLSCPTAPEPSRTTPEPSCTAPEPSYTSSIRSVNNVEADGVPRQRTAARKPSWRIHGADNHMRDDYNSLLQRSFVWYSQHQSRSESTLFYGARIVSVRIVSVNSCCVENSFLL